MVLSLTFKGTDFPSYFEITAPKAANNGFTLAAKKIRILGC